VSDNEHASAAVDGGAAGGGGTRPAEGGRPNGEAGGGLREGQDAQPAGSPDRGEQERQSGEAERRAADYREQLLRAQAEMDNLRKRTEREVENAHKYGTERLVAELLPVVDSLELGLAAAAGPEADVESVREGLELTLRMLRGVTEKFGIDVIDPQGDAFNPELHQAVSMREDADTGPGRVLAVVQKGYRLNGRLVRPAMVVVSR
jgi:molecular chaperone GrpE